MEEAKEREAIRRAKERQREREAKWRKRERLLGERRGASVYSRGQVVVVGTRGYS